MNMSAPNIAKTASLFLLMAFTLPAHTTVNAPEAAPLSRPLNTEDPRSQQLLQRLENIKGMDKSQLTRLEKKALRREVIAIKKEMKVIKGGVYLSVAAIIIIILLLILLL
jgi:hypothetical protein